ncbi:MAG: PaaI family thioesterase [Acidimicrobiales bacterium]
MADSWVSGLGLGWSKEPPGVVCTFVPDPTHRGPPGFLHGGLAAALLDETMAALSIVLDDAHTVTATLSLRYPKPVPLDGQPLRIEAWRDAARATRRIHEVRGRILLADGTVAVEASGLFARVPAP